MFWNNLIPSSLKLRLAITFAILFFISCSIVFFLTVSSLIYLKNKESLTEMVNIARNIEKIHVMGAKYNSSNIIRSGDSCPENIKQNILKLYPDARILYILTQDIPEESDLTGYHIYYILRQKKIYELIQLDGGKFSSRLVNPQNDRRVLTRYILLILGEYADEGISIEIKNPNGSTYLTSKSIIRSLPGMSQTPGEGGFQIYRSDLPDGKVVEIRKRLYQISAINSKYTETFFSVLVLVAMAGILVSWLIAARFIRGVRRMTSEMKLITASGDYARKISRRQMDKDQEIRELMENFNAMNEKTMILMEDLKMVSNNVAHDLRTPITRISGTMEALLRDRSLPENISVACASVTEECLHMKSMINTILDISRVNANPDLLKKESLDLCRIAEDFCDIMFPEVERKGLKIKHDFPDHPVMISADKMCVQRIISNLVENALKFTEQGGISLSLKETGSGIVFSVSDTGCGIPEENLDRIFDRFYRCDASRKYPGNGLGLSLVKAFVNAHEWSIECESSPGKGTTFRINIPQEAELKKS